MENDIFPSLFTKHYAASARLRSVLGQRSAVSAAVYTCSTLYAGIHRRIMHGLTYVKCNWL